MQTITQNQPFTPLFLPFLHVDNFLQNHRILAKIRGNMLYIAVAKKSIGQVKGVEFKQ